MSDQYLLAIVRHVDPKSIDWNGIAQECNIPTAAAARIRFTRLKAKLEKEAGGVSFNPTSPVKAQAKGTKRNSKHGAADEDANDLVRQDSPAAPKRAKNTTVKDQNTDEEALVFNKKETAKKRAPAKSKKSTKEAPSVADEDNILGDCEALDSPSKQLLQSSPATDEHNTATEAV